MVNLCQDLPETKLSKNDFEEFKTANAETLNDKVSIETFNEYKTNNEKRITDIQNVIDATDSDLESVVKNFDTYVAALDTKVSNDTFNAYKTSNDASVALKVNATDFDAFKRSNSIALDSKIGNDTFDAYRTANEKTIANKTNTTDFNAFKTSNTEELNGKVSNNVFDNYKTTNNAAVAKKLDTTTFNTYKTANDTAVGKKLDTTTFNTYKSSNDTAVASKVNTSDFNAFKTSNTAAIAKKLDSSLLDHPNLKTTIYNPISLGTSVTSTQWANIKNGTFKGLWLGAYWTIGGVVYRIVDFDYWLGKGQTMECTAHHLVIMPDNVMLKKVAFTTILDNTYGGYMTSTIRKEKIPSVQTTISGHFGSAHMLKHSIAITNLYHAGHADSVWVDSYVELPSVMMMLGNIGTVYHNGITVDNTQLSLFSKVPNKIISNANYWLRDISDSSGVLVVDLNGSVRSFLLSSTTPGIRPVFGICG